MGVKVADRTESKSEAVWQAKKLKDMIHELCIRSIGIKDPCHMVRSRYAIGADADNPQKYTLLLHNTKRRLHYLCDELIANTTAANKTRMNTVRRCQLRLDYQDKAVNNCEQLLNKLMDVIDTFDVDVNRYKQYNDAIKAEIELLKRWREVTVVQLRIQRKQDRIRGNV